MTRYRDLITIGSMFFLAPLCTAHGTSDVSFPAYMPDRFDRIQVPFIENKGAIENKEVAFFAKLLDGYVHVEKTGMITYNFSSAPGTGIVINEVFTEKPAALTPLEPPPEVAVRAFSEKGLIDAAISSYYRLSYGSIYRKIELQLLAFTDQLEKLFIVFPGGNPKHITVKTKGADGLKVNDTGALEILTKHGPVTFNKPRAYQILGEERKPVDVAYILRGKTSYGFKPAGYDKTKPLIIGPFLPPDLLPVQ